MSKPRPPSARKTEAPASEAVADRAMVREAGPTCARRLSSTSCCESESIPAFRPVLTIHLSARRGCTRSNGTGTVSPAYVADGIATIRTRNGHDWTKRFPAIARAAAGRVHSAVIDGEAVILDKRGGIAELQADLDHHRPERAVLCTLDQLFLDGETP